MCLAEAHVQDHDGESILETIGKMCIGCFLFVFIGLPALGPW